MSELIQARIWHAKHDGGTKDYRMILLHRADGTGEGFVIKRWGKVGAVGQIQIDSARTIAGAEGDFRRTAESKRGRGYNVVSNEIQPPCDFDDFVNKHHPLMSRAKSAPGGADLFKYLGAGAPKPATPDPTAAPLPEPDKTPRSESIAGWGDFS